MNNQKNFFLIALPGITFLIFWEIIVRTSPQLTFFFSSPTKIIETFAIEVSTLQYWQNFAYSSFSTVLGLILGTTIGTVIGILLWLKPWLEKLSRPYISAFGAVPIFAIAPMLIIWFGIGIYSKIMMAFLSVVLVSLVQATEGAKQVSDKHLIFAKALGANSFRIVKYIVLPGAASSVLNGIKMNVNFAIVGTFVAEFISSEFGVGHYILKAGGTYDTAKVFVGILTLICMSLVIQKLIKSFTPKRFR